MQRDNEDDAWRRIVDNFGDRADLGSEDPSTPPVAEPEPDDEDGEVDDETVQPVPVEERFVPPPPPPLPRPTGNRLVAWLGVFGSPTILLVALLAGISLPNWLGLLLVAGFVGGFLYLVAAMPHGPRDPWDDGAQL